MFSNTARLTFFVTALFGLVLGHGMLLDPPNRSSLWRFDSSSPINYDDNANFCGGFQVQWEINNGTCGICGDDFRMPQPRPNENTGKYGQGKVARNYTQGDNIEVNVLITANHLGYFTFSLCKLEDPDKPEQEECFSNIKLTDGSDVYKVPSSDVGYYKTDLKLPDEVVCDRCVLRWTYTTGNSWGVCPNGTGHLGCGRQETFRTCSDIRISKK